MFRALTTAFAALLAIGASATAQDYPARPITMVIPFAAGGPTDVLGRVVAARMSEILGQQVVVENVGGAGGMTGSKRVATAAPDGYQVVLGTVGTHAQGQTLYKKPQYDSVAEFAPVALLAEDFAHARRDHAAEHVGRAARRERDHHGDGTGGIVLRDRAAADRQQGGERGGQGSEHCFLHKSC